MIVVTGAAGFVGSCLLATLARARYADLVAVDDFSTLAKEPNLAGKKLAAKVHRTDFIEWLHQHHHQVQFVFHLGARTDTTEFDSEVFNRLNVNYSKEVWKACVQHGIPLIYASSAATYGDGSHGFADDDALVSSLKPLNPYGVSKNEFDKWVLDQPVKPRFWAGFKFFNVYGPNEYHKGRMASVVFHAYQQARHTGSIRLFRSHNARYRDGEQLRDFVYVRDVCSVLIFFMENRQYCGIYNLGSGKAETFLHLAGSVFSAMNLPEHIEFVDTPSDIRDKYQYETCATISKLRQTGYQQPFTPLADGIAEYVSHFLSKSQYL